MAAEAASEASEAEPSTNQVAGEASFQELLRTGLSSLRTTLEASHARELEALRVSSTAAAALAPSSAEAAARDKAPAQRAEPAMGSFTSITEDEAVSGGGPCLVDGGTAATVAAAAATVAIVGNAQVAGGGGGGAPAIAGGAVRTTLRHGSRNIKQPVLAGLRAAVPASGDVKPDIEPAESIQIPGALTAPLPVPEHEAVSGARSPRISVQLNSFNSEAVTCGIDGARLEEFKVARSSTAELLPVWQQQSASSRKLTVAQKQCRAPMSNVTCGDISALVEQEERLNEVFEKYERGRVTTSVLQHFVIHPSSSKRMCWDVVSVFLVIYDMVAIPFQLFEPPESVLVTNMSWMTRLFWTGDLPLSFFSGYMTEDGFFEQRPKFIARRYVKTWFCLDLLIVSSDWLDLILGVSSGMDYARMGKASRTIRIVRLLRLLRLLKSMQIVGGFVERFQSERLGIVASIAKIICFIVAWSHVSACIFYGLGSSNAPDERSWLDVHEIRDQTLTYRYLTSLHWALSQFTGGMDEVTAENSRERVYVAAMLLGALIMAASFTSNLTSSMTRLHILTSGQSQQLALLRRFLSQNGISNRLALRIQRNAQLGVTSKQIPETAVDLMPIVSLPLQIELHFEMFLPGLLVHPFFAKYNAECSHVMREICHSSTTMLRVGCGDTIFNAGERPLEPKMYVVRRGTLEYIHISGCVNRITEDQWICEAVLWVKWMHRGILKATGECIILQIDSLSFQKIVPRFEHPGFDPSAYAAKFASALHERELRQDVLQDYIDLPVQELIDSMGLPCESLDKSRPGSRTALSTVVPSFSSIDSG